MDIDRVMLIKGQENTDKELSNFFAVGENKILGYYLALNLDKALVKDNSQESI